MLMSQFTASKLEVLLEYYEATDAKLEEIMQELGLE